VFIFNSISNLTVNITISSVPQNKVMKISDNWIVDVDGDGNRDVKIIITSFSADTVGIIIWEFLEGGVVDVPETNISFTSNDSSSSGAMPEESRKTLITTLIVVLIILFLLFAFFIASHFIRESSEEKPKRINVSSGAEAKMRKFILDSRLAGTSDVEIKQSLLAAGWRPEQLMNFFRS